MKTSYFSFHGDIHVTSVNNLIFNCEREIKDGAEHLYISISSRGGLSDSGFHLYNTLKAMKAKITMHNTGSVESAGFVAFLAGDNRLSSPDSRFLVHKPMRRFNADTSFDEKQISEFSQLLKNDELNIRNIILKNTSATKAQITAWLKMRKARVGWGELVNPNSIDACICWGSCRHPNLPCLQVRSGLRPPPAGYVERWAPTNRFTA